jgi:hypothetical protein
MRDFEYGGMGVDAVLGPVAVGSWGSFWKKFKNIFKKVAKKVATSDQVKVALNNVSPGAGDAAQNAMKLIDSAASGNPVSLAQVKAISDAAKSGDTTAQPAHDLLTTVNDARKEAKAETVTAMVGAAMQDIEALRGRHFRLTEKKDGKEMVAVMKIINVHPEAYIEFEVVGMPGSKEWIPLSKLYNGMVDKEVVWSDEKGVPLAVQPVTITTVPVVAPAAKVGAEPQKMYEVYIDRVSLKALDIPLMWKILEKDYETQPGTSIVQAHTGPTPMMKKDVDRFIKSKQWEHRGVESWASRRYPSESKSALGYDVYLDTKTTFPFDSLGRMVWKVLDKNYQYEGTDDAWLVMGYTDDHPMKKANIDACIKTGVWKYQGADSWTELGGGGGHHGGHGGGFGGMMRMDPRDLYWGPRVDFDDDGQPVFVGRGGHHGGGGRGWGGGWGVPYAPWGGMWGMPMWEEIEYVEDDEPTDDDAAAKAKKAKATLKVMAGIATQDWTAPDWSSSDAGEEVKKLLEAAGIKHFDPAGKVVVDGDTLRVDLSQLSPKHQRKANNLMAMTATLCARGKKIVVNVPVVAVGGGGGHHGGHHGSFPGGVMMGPGWGDYSPYPYPGADPWMFEEMEYQTEAGKRRKK